MILSLFIFACGTDPENEDNNDLGGDTNIALGEVGNTAYTVVEMNGNYTRLDGMEITENENGIVNLKVNTDISNISDFSKIYDLFPDEMKDGNGKINANLKIKITSEGIQDFLKNDEPHTLVKYDCNVGDSYSTTMNGQKLTRKVVAKSSVDDFQWGMMDIKTITTEQNSSIPGIDKYVFKTNHKFGLVFVSVYLEDGTSVGMYIYPSNY